MDSLFVWLLLGSIMVKGPAMAWHVPVRYSLSWLNNMPFYGYTTFLKFIHRLINIWGVSSDWLLQSVLLCILCPGCCHNVSTFVGYMSRSGTLNHMLPCLAFWGAAKPFSTAAAPRCEGSSFSTSSPTLVFLVVAVLMVTKWDSVVCRFDLHFPRDEWPWALFHMLGGCWSSVEKCLLKSLAQFEIWLFIFCSWSIKIGCVLWILVPWCGNNFSHFVVYFHFLDSVFWHTRVFYFF